MDYSQLLTDRLEGITHPSKDAESHVKDILSSIAIMVEGENLPRSAKDIIHLGLRTAAYEKILTLRVQASS